jgi:hypothetical protein
MKRIIILLLVLCTSLGLHAQNPETFVGEHNRFGLKAKDGKTLLPARYDFISLFFNGFAYVSLNNKKGFVDRSGKFITPIKYDAVISFENGFARVNLGGVWKEDEDEMDDGYVDGGKWAVINKLGKEITPFKYDAIGPMMPEGFAAATADSKWGVVNTTGKEIVPLKYDNLELSDSETSIALACIGGKKDPLADEEQFNQWYGGKQGFVDCMTGKIVTPIIYDNAADFYEGLAAVRLNGKWGFVDNKGRVAIPIRYDVVGDFDHGKAGVKLNGKNFFIDKTGKEIK